MSFKDILVHVDAGPGGLACAALATDLAQAHQAYVTGLFLKRPSREPSALAVAAGAYVGDVDTDARDRESAEAGKLMERCETEFKQEVERAGVKGEWQVLAGSSRRDIIRYPGYADLIVVGQAKPDESENTTDVAGEIALACGRPVLIVPYVPISPVGDRIMVAWNGRRESIRAVHDALPFLKRARFVALLEIAHTGIGTDALHGIVQHLARHGVRAERYVTEGADWDVGEALLSRADNFNADLIVMGAYGHTRLREFVLGGTTRTVLAMTRLPILLSH